LPADWPTGLRKPWHIWTALAVAAAAGCLVWIQAGPPGTTPSEDGAEIFSAARARRHVEQVARVPHPLGSPANTRVRDYIVSQLEALGIAASVERQTAFYRASPVAFRGGMVENVIGRIPGSANTKAVMLACHYDSVVEDGGAADDGSGVGVLLEAARALRQAPPLRNDVLLVFTDGEEPDLMGSEAFISQSPLSRDVGLVLNFEARGTSGPGLMFQTSQPDGALIREFARAAPHPRAASFFRHVYERMPSDTDFTFFNLKGIPGLNFAFIEGGGFYHTSEDNLERLDTRSLQHQGSSALALARHLGSLPLPLPPSPNLVYFNAGNVLVHYPVAWVWAIETVLLALWILAAYAARRRFNIRGGELLLGLLGVVGIECPMALAAYGYLRLIEKLHVVRNELSFGQQYGRWWLLCAFLILAGMAGLRLVSGLAGRIGRAGLCAAAVLIQLVIAGLLCWKFPAASHLGMAGAGTGLLLLGLLLWEPGPPALWLPAAAIALLPALLIWVPLMRYLDAGLGIAIWPVQAFLAAQWMVFVGAAFFPSKPALSARVWIAVTAMAALLLTIGVVSSRYDARHPRPSNAFYALDADRHAAYWVSRQGALDPWTASVLGPRAKREPFLQISPFSDEPFWRSPAPEFPLPRPELDLIQSTCAGGFRTFELQARSPRGARNMLMVALSDRDTEILSLNGREPTLVEPFRKLPHKAVFIELRALPPGGMALRLRIQNCGKLVSRVVERSNDLEAVFPGGVPPLPAGLMTAWEDDYYNRSVVVTRFLTFP